jgi:hypothetical protein
MQLPTHLRVHRQVTMYNGDFFEAIRYHSSILVKLFDIKVAPRNPISCLLLTRREMGG